MYVKLSDIEKELTVYLTDDKKTWIRMYQLMNQVDSEKLWQQADNVNIKSFSAWIRDLANRLGVHESLLWARLKSGRVYAEYADRAEKKGKYVPSLDSVPLTVSPDSIALAKTVGGTDPDRVDYLIDRVVDGTLNRADLREMAHAKKQQRSASSSPTVGESLHDDMKTADEKESAAMTAAQIVDALRHDQTWLPTIEKTTLQDENDISETSGVEKKRKHRDDVFHVVTEVRAASGTTHYVRRIDAVVAETLTEPQIGHIRIHGIEIKADLYDLKGDHKMSEYVPYVDLFWLAVPDIPSMVATAKEIALPNWGILAISTSSARNVRAVRPAFAGNNSGLMRDETLAALVIRARDFRQ